MPNRYVLDSYALIGYLEDEPFAGKIETILNKGVKGELQLFLHAIHLGEVYYITLREQGQDSADLAYSRIKAFPTTLINEIDEELLLTAASLKANYPISYADSFAAAISIIYDCPLLTGDPEYRILEKNGIISVDWLK